MVEILKIIFKKEFDPDKMDLIIVADEFSSYESGKN